MKGKLFWIGGVVVLLLAVGVTFAIAQSETPPMYFACVNNDSGTIKVFLSEEDRNCKANEFPVTWGEVGPEGPIGPQGPAGPPGPAGVLASLDELEGTPCNSGAGILSVIYSSISSEVTLYCVSECGPGQTNCSGSCANLNTDSSNCGVCGNSCESDQSCEFGVCTPPSFCEPGQTVCSDTCVDLSTDANNCGSCEASCLEGQACVNGTCSGPSACTDGSTQPCSTGQPGIGVCQAGIQTCANGLWGACVGEVLPIPEVCDLEDNDCDGTIDEDFPDVGTQCYAGEGACRIQGYNVCSASGQGTICDAIPGPPGFEVCDGIDNDCDALVDEGGVCEGLCFYIGGGLYQADNCIYEDSTCSSTPLSCEG